MDNYKLYKGIVNKNIFEEFEEKHGLNLLHHSANSCNVDDFLSVAYTLCPDFVEINGYIFVSDLFDVNGENAKSNLKILEEQFNNDKKLVEMWVNSRSVGDFFIGKYTKSLDNDRILNEFSSTLISFWKRRVKEIFPDRNIVIEVGNEIMGELGLTITMYQAD